MCPAPPLHTLAMGPLPLYQALSKRKQTPCFPSLASLLSTVQRQPVTSSKGKSVHSALWMKTHTSELTASACSLRSLKQPPSDLPWSPPLRASAAPSRPHLLLALSALPRAFLPPSARRLPVTFCANACLLYPEHPTRARTFDLSLARPSPRTVPATEKERK